MATVAVVVFVIFRLRRKYSPVHAVLKITVFLSRHLYIYRNKNYSNLILYRVSTWVVKPHAMQGVCCLYNEA
jgi:hypothetical protein